MPPTVISADGSYEWEATKDAANQRAPDHGGVGFAEAASVLDHPQTVDIPEGGGEGRLKWVGFSRQGRVLTVVFEPRGERDRIISAWPSTPEELRQFSGDTDGE